jgi:hypothetical protein
MLASKRATQVTTTTSNMWGTWIFLITKTKSDCSNQISNVLLQIDRIKADTSEFETAIAQVRVLVQSYMPAALPSTQDAK